MKQTLHVNINDYNIEISDGNLQNLKSDLDDFTAGKKRLFVISKRVYDIYNRILAINPNELLILPDGEQEKNFKNYIKILETACKLGLTRADLMIAIGGGVIGDITGFAASTYMRGIDYIQVPTTLLSMVDSSVGGKTAIDLNDGKNIVGTFHQPKAVFININFLKTLDRKNLLSGAGEILKYAFIEDSCGYDKSVYFYEYLTLCCDKFFDLDSVSLIRLIDYSLRLKIAVVEADEKESSLRKVLNFGHTLAHALEAITKYKKFSHGEAVVYGMFFAFDTAYKKGLINYSYYRLSVELLEKYTFKNINIPKMFNTSKLIELMSKDKKSKNNKIVMMLPVSKKQVKEFEFDPSEICKMF